ncbi:MAG: putative viral replication protein [Cressdnaviricota sp.]|nr:MAG: putative viral replication protein [Cressdnaviricota sp.]
MSGQKKVTKAPFQSPKVDYSQLQLSTDNMRLAKLTTTERKASRIILPQVMDDRGDETEVYDEDSLVQLVPWELSRAPTMRLPCGDDLPDLFKWNNGRKMAASSKFDDIPDGEVIGNQWVTKMNTIDEDSDDDGMVPIRKRKAVEQLVQEEPKKAKGQGRKVTRYCFTWNNPSIDGNKLKEYFESNELFASGVFQMEEGDNKVKHFQGYVELSKACYVTALHKAMGNHKMHWEYANGSKIQNHKYCTKEDTRVDGPWYVKMDKEFFLGRKTQGRRSDLDEFATAAVEAGGVNSDLMEQYPGYAMKHSKQAKDLISMLALRKAKEDERAYWKEEARLHAAGEATQGQQQRHLELYFGPTAAGKTTMIKRKIIGDEDKSLYTKNCANKWWCGYDGDQVILMDEFRGDSFGQMEEFNNITNLGALQVEMKGGNTVLLATEMHFASNRHPVHWWKKNATSYFNWDDARYRAVVRRFKVVHWWNESGVYTKLENPGIEKNTDEWRTANAAWKAFWVWNSRPVEEGDMVDTANLPGYFDLVPSQSSE